MKHILLLFILASLTFFTTNRTNAYQPGYKNHLKFFLALPYESVLQKEIEYRDSATSLDIFTNYIRSFQINYQFFSNIKHEINSLKNIHASLIVNPFTTQVRSERLVYLLQGHSNFLRTFLEFIVHFLRLESYLYQVSNTSYPNFKYRDYYRYYLLTSNFSYGLFLKIKTKLLEYEAGYFDKLFDSKSYSIRKSMLVDVRKKVDSLFGSLFDAEYLLIQILENENLPNSSASVRKFHENLASSWFAVHSYYAIVVVFIIAEEVIFMDSCSPMMFDAKYFTILDNENLSLIFSLLNQTVKEFMTLFFRHISNLYRSWSMRKGWPDEGEFVKMTHFDYKYALSFVEALQNLLGYFV